MHPTLPSAMPSLKINTGSPESFLQNSDVAVYHNALALMCCCASLRRWLRYAAHSNEAAP